WAGINIEPITKYTDCIMIILLEQYNAFINFPILDSHDAVYACHYVQSRSFPECQNGILVVDKYLFNIDQKLGLHGESFYSRKS
ncbi:hypothetical protein P692DRAFT_20717306, partial [Suillus brevipes Sb2]